MFSLERRSHLIGLMANDHPVLVQNMEILFENRLLLDSAYHYPKEFILHLNNCFRAVLSFVESSIKNSPPWLKECVSSFRDEHLEDYDIIRHLRDVSLHQALVFPAESLVTGLYRIRAPEKYVLKLGFGDHGKPNEYSWDIAMRNSDEIFHPMLVFSSMIFMDLEHGAIGECLGLTRQWFFKVKFKNKRALFDKQVDVYSLVCQFVEGALDAVCEAFSAKSDVDSDISFKIERGDHNLVNTLLEVDLYPSLFQEWWGGDVSPLNYGIRHYRMIGEGYENLDRIHKECYENLIDSPVAYLEALDKYAQMSDEDVLNEDNLSKFYSFVHLNHWHAKKSFPHTLKGGALDVLDVSRLQRFGRNYLNEISSAGTCPAYGRQFREHLKTMSLSIREKMKKY